MLALALLGGGAWALGGFLNRGVIVDHAQFEPGLATRAFFVLDTIDGRIELFDRKGVFLEPGADGFIKGVRDVTVASSDPSVVVAEAVDNAGMFLLVGMAPGTSTISARVFMENGLERAADPINVVVKEREPDSATEAMAPPETDFETAMKEADKADDVAADSTAGDSLVLAQYRQVLARYGPVLLERRPRMHGALTTKAARFEELESLRVRADSAIADSVGLAIAPRFAAVNAYYQRASELRPNGGPDRSAMTGWVEALDTLTYARLARASICRSATRTCGPNTRVDSLPLGQSARVDLGVVLGNDRAVRRIYVRWLHGGELQGGERQHSADQLNPGGFGITPGPFPLDREGTWTLEVMNGRRQRILVHDIEVH